VVNRRDPAASAARQRGNPGRGAWCLRVHNARGLRGVHAARTRGVGSPARRSPGRVGNPAWRSAGRRGHGRGQLRVHHLAELHLGRARPGSAVHRSPRRRRPRRGHPRRAAHLAHGMRDGRSAGRCHRDGRRTGRRPGSRRRPFAAHRSRVRARHRDRPPVPWRVHGACNGPGATAGRHRLRSVRAVQPPLLGRRRMARPAGVWPNRARSNLLHLGGTVHSVLGDGDDLPARGSTRPVVDLDSALRDAEHRDAGRWRGRHPRRRRPGWRIRQAGGSRDGRRGRAATGIRWAKGTAARCGPEPGGRSSGRRGLPHARRKLQLIPWRADHSQISA
jgi:hypothetical protein